MLSPGQFSAMLALQAALVAVVGGAVWGRRRIAAGARRRLDRIELRLASLESASRRIEGSLAVPRAIGSPPAIGERRDPPRRPTPPHPRPAREAEPPGPTLIAVPDLSRPARAIGSQADAARRATASGDLARRFARIWALADEGAPADRIATATGQPIGQVELVLNLRRRLIDAPDDDRGRDGGSVEVPA